MEKTACDRLFIKKNLDGKGSIKNIEEVTGNGDYIVHKVFSNSNYSFSGQGGISGACETFSSSSAVHIKVEGEEIRVVNSFLTMKRITPIIYEVSMNAIKKTPTGGYMKIEKQLYNINKGLLIGEPYTNPKGTIKKFLDSNLLKDNEKELDGSIKIKTMVK